MFPHGSPSPKYWFEKRARRKSGYPVASLAYYGPDDRFASKAVVGITLAEKDESATFLEKWFSTGSDVRTDPLISQQILEFLQAHDIHRIVTIERIIGCPHEEGIDYPDGETCPQCPFWENIDRWTGEKLEK